MAYSYAAKLAKEATIMWLQNRNKGIPQNALFTYLNRFFCLALIITI